MKMVTSKNGEVRLVGTRMEIIADIGAALSVFLDNTYDFGMSEKSAEILINRMVNAAFESSKYADNCDDKMDDELNMIDAFNKALDEVENKFRRKNVKRDLYT